MTNQSDYRYRWRFTHRSLALLEDDMLIGELVRLEGGEWASIDSFAVMGGQNG